ncbi:hypothetical protein I5M27_13475 [Adhaeribacter sp. BT258]|uniref:Uncharacterized protein n=1 Tax=Adhaeribacter terrigena TaxID=2793070 RepID=A0ABS1C3M9_9BACT|nr:hypothetical protein [Adhaeribacter terrigena]MBK0403999.1 hypothetical protein [Adhaeribacter terrigena]
MLLNEDVLNQPVTPVPAVSRQRTVAANSTILFLLAYLVSYLAYQIATLAAAFSARIPTVFHLGHLEFKIPDSAWRTADVIAVYAAGPVVALALAFLAGVLFMVVRKKRGLQKTFFLWTFLHGCNLFFGALIAGTITKSGFWFAIRWSGFNDTALWIMAFLFIFILLAIGVLAAPAFLFSCDSISLMEFQNRPKMLAATVMYPWLFGSFFLVLLKFPDLQYYELLQIFTLMLILLPVYFLNQQNLFSETVEMPKRTRLAQTALVLLVIMAVAYRLLLQHGRFFN